MINGKVFWVTGLSGAGKTTIGKLLYKEIGKQKNNVVFLDGDVLREVFGNDLTYSIQDRKKSAMRNSRLCKVLSEQGLDVVCCTISMFNDVRDWNRQNIKNYFEIYLKVPLEVLKLRDQKGLYSSHEKGKTCNVYGLDLEYEEPSNPDIVINNDGLSSPEDIVETIMKKLVSNV